MIQDRKIIEFNQGRAILEVDCYIKTGRLSIDAHLIDSDEDFGSITIDLPYLFIKDYDEGFIDNIANSDLFDLIPKMKELGIIEKSYGIKKYNCGTYEYVKFNIEKLKEYDKEGVENYLSLSNKIEHNISI